MNEKWVSLDAMNHVWAIWVTSTYLNLNIYCLSAGSTKRLVDHDPCIGHAVSLANLARPEKECTHGCCQTKAVCLYICLAQIDCVIDSHARSHRATCARDGGAKRAVLGDLGTTHLQAAVGQMHACVQAVSFHVSFDR